MEGKLVRLRGYEISDADALVRWMSDEEVTNWIGPTEYPVTRAAQERMIRESAEPDARSKSFGIETLDGTLIGDCGIRTINWKNRSAEVFITIGDKRFWSQGYGTDAIRLLIRLGFDKMNLHSLWLTTLAINARAIRCYEKCGFERQGLYREASYVAGRYVDVVPMGLLRSDYKPPHN